MKKLKCDGFLKYRLDNSFKYINAISKDCEVTEFDDPFRYIIIDNLLKPEVHKEIKDELESIKVDYDKLLEGVLFTPWPVFVPYKGDWHDAYRMSLDPNYDLKMNFFQNRQWFKFITNFWPEIEFTNEVVTEVHHHEELSRDGFIHADYEPDQFFGGIIPEEITFFPEENRNRSYDGLDTGWLSCRSEACDQFDGLVDTNNRYVQRSLSNIYYVGQGPKVHEDKPAGGHTAFFRRGDPKPVAGVEPIENRLVMFENTPDSLHASRTNNSTYRDSIYNWWHSEMEFQKKRFPSVDQCKNIRGTHELGTAFKASDGMYGEPVDG